MNNFVCPVCRLLKEARSLVEPNIVVTMFVALVIGVVDVKYVVIFVGVIVNIDFVVVVVALVDALKTFKTYILC